MSFFFANCEFLIPQVTTCSKVLRHYFIYLDIYHNNTQTHYTHDLCLAIETNDFVYTFSRYSVSAMPIWVFFYIDVSW